MGQLLVKTGVDFGTSLSFAGARILEELRAVVQFYPFDVTITSARDGKHSGPDDPHHSGEAFDIRTRDLTTEQKRRLLNDIQARLYKVPRRFFAQLEKVGTPDEHIHVQRRASTRYGINDYLRSA